MLDNQQVGDGNILQVQPRIRPLFLLTTCSPATAEPAGAASGVAYLMTLVLSSKSVDPKTLAPEGTVLNAKKVSAYLRAVRMPQPVLCGRMVQVVRALVLLHAACRNPVIHWQSDQSTTMPVPICVTGPWQADDVRAAVRVPFTRIVPTALAVIDTTNDSSSGAGCAMRTNTKMHALIATLTPGMLRLIMYSTRNRTALAIWHQRVRRRPAVCRWAQNEDGLPKLPITSVLAVLGVGTVIVEVPKWPAVNDPTSSCYGTPILCFECCCTIAMHPVAAY